MLFKTFEHLQHLSSNFQVEVEEFDLTKHRVYTLNFLNIEKWIFIESIDVYWNFTSKLGAFDLLFQVKAKRFFTQREGIQFLFLN
jgi:hypothetical protein